MARLAADPRRYLSIQPAVGTLPEEALAGNPFPMGQPTAPKMVFETMCMWFCAGCPSRIWLANLSVWKGRRFRNENEILIHNQMAAD
jgi:hypothetical protein